MHKKTKAGAGNLFLDDGAEEKDTVEWKMREKKAENEIDMAVRVVGSQKISKPEEKEDSEAKKPKGPEGPPDTTYATMTMRKDTYAMAFKALHWESALQIKLSPFEVHNAFHAAVMVTFIQFLMLGVVWSVIFADNNPNPIEMSPTVLVLGLRFIVSLLMHLQVEADVR